MNFAQSMYGIAIIYILINKAVREAWPKALNAGLSAIYSAKKSNFCIVPARRGIPETKPYQRVALIIKF
ncbi:hypothetical protein BJP34_00370 [Moorena producens PAL-8-15-08-1]|uniref:Uncharacterized protein n=1 Tax=Moorena producens PAL-8-15-08-1 TaxID=1458985 RepID=A0A1D8TKB6_9CYAN|nr:hypothetical protein BJP34_00370 [Moorena producens PAL-8-15-08-1]